MRLGLRVSDREEKSTGHTGRIILHIQSSLGMHLDLHEELQATDWKEARQSLR